MNYSNSLVHQRFSILSLSSEILLFNLEKFLFNETEGRFKNHCKFKKLKSISSVSYSNKSECIVYTIEPINHASKNVCSDTNVKDVYLGSSPDSSENFIPSATPVCERISNFLETGSTLQTLTDSEKTSSWSEILLNISVTAQRPPPLQVPATPTTNPTINP